jgi:hypothetical protein
VGFQAELYLHLLASIAVISLVLCLPLIEQDIHAYASRRQSKQVQEFGKAVISGVFVAVHLYALNRQTPPPSDIARDVTMLCITISSQWPDFHLTKGLQMFIAEPIHWKSGGACSL